MRLSNRSRACKSIVHAQLPSPDSGRNPRRAPGTICTTTPPPRNRTPAYRAGMLTRNRIQPSVSAAVLSPSHAIGWRASRSIGGASCTPSARTISAANCRSSAASNSLTAVTISGMMQPSAHTSSPWPTVPRQHTSGARYGTAWNFFLRMVGASLARNAQPKSMIFTRWLLPSPEQNIMLSGLRSACTMPRCRKPAKPLTGRPTHTRL